MNSGTTKISIDVITAQHRYSGLFDNNGHRLADVLNDTRSDIVELQQVLVASGGSRSTELRCGQVILRRKEVLLAVPREAYETPAKRANHYKKLERRGAMVALPGCVLTGIVHLSPRTRSWMVLDDDGHLSAFFGMTDVTVHGATHGLLPVNCPTVIVQRRAIEALELSVQVIADPDCTRAAESGSVNPMESPTGYTAHHTPG